MYIGQLWKNIDTVFLVHVNKQHLILIEQRAKRNNWIDNDVDIIALLSENINFEYIFVVVFHCHYDASCVAIIVMNIMITNIFVFDIV